MHAQVLSTLLCLWLGQPAPSDAEQNVEIQFARAQLQLAEANLNRMQQMNRRLARTVPASVVAEYQQDVELAKAQLQQAEAGSAANEFQVWLRRAETVHKTAETNWKNAVAANQRASGTVEAVDVERFRLRAEVTRLQAARGQKLAQAPREAQLQWEVDLLNYEMQRLREETTRLAPYSRSYPVWWY
jgi:hypothetical protein